MSVLHTENGCTLVSHKDYVDRIYNKVVDAGQNSGEDFKTFRMRADVFDISSNQNDSDEKKRYRKINAKKYSIAIAKNPQLHNLVSESTKIHLIVKQQLN